MLGWLGLAGSVAFCVLIWCVCFELAPCCCSHLVSMTSVLSSTPRPVSYRLSSTPRPLSYRLSYMTSILLFLGHLVYIPSIPENRFSEQHHNLLFFHVPWVWPHAHAPLPLLPFTLHTHLSLLYPFLSSHALPPLLPPAPPRAPPIPPLLYPQVKDRVSACHSS
jgi:hypothetical protein